MQRVLAGLTLFVPTVVWAGFNMGKNLDYVLLALLMVVVSAVMALMLIVSLFTSNSQTTPSFWVSGANLLVTGVLVALGDHFSAYLLAMAGGVLFVLALLVHVGESMAEASKAKQRAARLAQRKAAARAPSEPVPPVERPWR